MATKAELEAELALLREQNETLRRQSDQRSEDKAESEDTAKNHFPAKLQDILDEHGIDSSSVEAMGGQLNAELVKFQRDQPLLALLGAFAIGCVVGRALR